MPNSKFETRIKSVAVYFANVVIHTAGAQHRPGDAGVNRQFGREFANVLCASDDDLIAENQFLKLIEKLWEPIRNLLCPGQPLVARIHAAATKAHVVAHHTRTG